MYSLADLPLQSFSDLQSIYLKLFLLRSHGKLCTLSKYIHTLMLSVDKILKKLKLFDLRGSSTRNDNSWSLFLWWNFFPICLLVGQKVFLRVIHSDTLLEDFELLKIFFSSRELLYNVKSCWQANQQNKPSAKNLNSF